MLQPPGGFADAAIDEEGGVPLEEKVRVLAARGGPAGGGLARATADKWRSLGGSALAAGVVAMGRGGEVNELLLLLLLQEGEAMTSQL